MPKLGATMQSGTIVRWLKEPGDPVAKGEPLLEIETDKVTMELDAPSDGLLLHQCFPGQTEVAVNEPIGYIGQPGEAFPDPAGSPHHPQQSAPPTVAGAADAPGDTDDAANAPSGTDRVRATPAARAVARKHRIPLGQVAGTGPLGRIQRADVEHFMASSATPVPISPLAAKMAAGQKIDLTRVQGSGVRGKIMSADIRHHLQEAEATADRSGSTPPSRPLEGIRRIIAKRTTASAFSAPHVTLFSEVDMTECRRLREWLLPIVERQTGVRLSYTEMIIKAVALALRAHPEINVSLQEDRIVLHPHVHVGLAVSVPDGLVVPVIQDADQKGLATLTKECKALARLAREGKLELPQMTGGTFTISNLGMYAVDAFTPIINQPESAILGVGRIGEKPVGFEGSIVLRSMMTLSLSFDHRVMDGAPAAAFLTQVKESLEQPGTMLV